MGEFNAGKSSFVNVLAGEAVAPTGVTPTTATVNVLRYAPNRAHACCAMTGAFATWRPGMSLRSSAR